MKILLYLYFFTFSIISIAQKNELNLGFRYGMSTSQLSIVNTSDKYSRVKYSKLNSFNDKGYFINYKYKFWSKFNSYLNFGMDYSKSKSYLRIIFQKYGYNLENVSISNKRLDFTLGLSKQFKLYKSNNISLELGYNLIYRFYFKNKNYINKPYYSSNNEDWIEYTYYVETFHKQVQTTNFLKKPNKFSNLFYVNINFKLTDNFFLNFGINYLTYIEYYFNYNYKINYYINNNTVPYYEDHLGYMPDPAKLHSNYLYSSIGISYKF